MYSNFLMNCKLSKRYVENRLTAALVSANRLTDGESSSCHLHGSFAFIYINTCTSSTNKPNKFSVIRLDGKMSGSSVDLGFLDKCDDSWLLTNTYFPSKVGGRPAWLDVESIPENDRLKCNECGKQFTFLCQVNMCAMANRSIFSMF